MFFRSADCPENAFFARPRKAGGGDQVLGLLPRVFPNACYSREHSLQTGAFSHLVPGYVMTSVLTGNSRRARFTGALNAFVVDTGRRFLSSSMPPGTEGSNCRKILNGEPDSLSGRRKATTYESRTRSTLALCHEQFRWQSVVKGHHLFVHTEASFCSEVLLLLSVIPINRAAP
jgi:hypothetical protein